MRSLRKVLRVACVAATLTAAALPVSAQMGPGPGPGPGAGYGTQRGGGKLASSECQRRLQRLTQRLGLSEEQQAQLKPLLEQEAAQVQQLREDATLTKEERSARLRELRESTYTRINEYLTPEQRQKHEELRNQATQRQKTRRGPPPAAIPPAK